MRLRHCSFAEGLGGLQMSLSIPFVESLRRCSLSRGSPAPDKGRRQRSRQRRTSKTDDEATGWGAGLRVNWRRWISLLTGAVVLAGPSGGRVLAAPVPILYSTDLLHPHDDPDDHYDLATLFALEEFELLGIVLDLGERQVQRPGRLAVEQMMRITGRPVPCAIGLGRPLKNREDDARDQAPEFQRGVELILSGLRASAERVVVFTTGSCRDVAAAFNREPELLRTKIRALYINVGKGPNEPQDEWNVKLDPVAYQRLFESGLPLFWCPCFGTNGFQTYFVVDQAKVVGACISEVQNFFVYCLSKAKEDPLAFLASGPHPVPTGDRNMWCTAPLLHAAGRQIYERGPGDYVALRVAEARATGLADRVVEVFRFEPIRAELRGGTNDPFVELSPVTPNARVFRSVEARYPQILGSCLRNLLADRARQHHPTLGTPPETNAQTGWLEEITLLHLASQTAGR